MLRNEFDIIDLIIPTLERQTASLVEDETIIQIDIDAAALDRIRACQQDCSVYKYI